MFAVSFLSAILPSKGFKHLYWLARLGGMGKYSYVKFKLGKNKAKEHKFLAFGRAWDEAIIKW